MNTGLSDAFSLIWRLSLLVKHPRLPSSAKIAILGSYDTERRSTAKEVIDVAAQLVRSTKTEAKHYVELIEKNAGFITGMGVTYSGLNSACVRESEKSVFKAGERCPDLWLQDDAGEDIRLYQKFRYGRYVFLAIGETAHAESTGFDQDLVSIIKVRPLKGMNVGVDNKGRDIDVGSYGKDAFGCSYAKMGESFLVLVRPDCYVEYVGETEEVLRYFKERYWDLIN